MTIQQLQYVVALDTHRHFVKAAKSRHVAQPTLTLQVKKLEDEIGLVLFDRSSKPLVPTPLGKIFIEKTRTILNEIAELKETVNTNRENIEGEFRIGMIPTLLPNLLPLFITDFIQNHPKTKLIIDELQSEKIIELLLQKELDIGILATPLNERHIREVPLFYEPFMVYTNQKDEALIKKQVLNRQLRPEGLWLLQKGHCFRNHTLNVCQFDASKQHKNIALEGGSIATLKKMVQTISGYTLIPELAYDEKTDAPYVIPFSKPQPVREISIVTHKHFFKEKLIIELRKSILKNTPDHFKKNTRYKTITWR
ncbi:MAG: LysR substrate-binding domain-containing protein [Bacteroidota bacterium]